VYSYYARRSIIPDSHGRQLFRTTIPVGQVSKALKYTLRRVGIFIIVIALLVTTASVLSLSTQPRILPLDPSRRTYLKDASVYEQAAHHLLDASVMNRTKITIDSAGISGSLKHQFPELAAVVVRLPLIDRRPIIYVLPAIPSLVLTTQQGQSYVVDDNGVALARLNNSAGSIYARLPIVKDESGASVSSGNPALPTSTVAFIHSVEYQLNQKGLTTSLIVLPAGKSELDVSVDGQPYFVKFNLASTNVRGQVGTFLAVRHNLQEQGTVPTEYVDVRVDGRAYYK